MISLVGMGGVGKTRIALELAARVAARFEDGARFVDLGVLGDGALVPRAIATALALPEITDVTLLELVVTALSDGHVLLVIDNCEHVITAAASAIDTILARCPAVTVLATSRESLRIDGETVYRLPTLDVPPVRPAVTADEALRYSAVGLFVELSRARNSALTISSDTVLAAAEICRRLDGIPLALELAAAKASVLNLPQIALRLSERFALLTDGSRTALPRQQTLRALIDWSFELLVPAEQQLFACLSTFAGSFTLTSAETVAAGVEIAAADVLTLISSLVEKSLVLVDENSPAVPRFRLLETTREYAAARLRETGRRDAVMRALTAGVVTFARRAQSLLRDMMDSAWLDMVEAELGSVRAALVWSLRDENDSAAGAEISALLGFFWDMRSYDEGARWLFGARGRLSLLEPRLSALVLSELVRISPFTDEAFELASQSLETYRSLGDERGTATALEYLGQTLINLGRYEDAVRALAGAAESARDAEPGSPAIRMVVLLGFAQLYGRDVTSAQDRAAEARRLAAPHTRVRDFALLLRLEAEIALASGDDAAAISNSERTLEQLERVGSVRGIGSARYLVAHALLAACRFPEAYAHATAAVRLLSSAQIPLAFLEACCIWAAAARHASRAEAAARVIGFSRARSATLRVRSAFLIAGLARRTVTELAEQLGARRFDELAAEGATFDTSRVLHELDEEDDVAAPKGVVHAGLDC
jgi:predicted ATPase